MTRGRAVPIPPKRVIVESGYEVRDVTITHWVVAKGKPRWPLNAAGEAVVGTLYEWDEQVFQEMRSAMEDFRKAEQALHAKLGAIRQRAREARIDSPLGPVVQVAGIVGQPF